MKRLLNCLLILALLFTLSPQSFAYESGAPETSQQENGAGNNVIDATYGDGETSLPPYEPSNINVIDATYNSDEDSMMPTFLLPNEEHENSNRSYNVIKSTYGDDERGIASRGASSSSITTPPLDPTLLKTLNDMNSQHAQSLYSISKNNENISTFDGSLGIHTTDLSLPGRNGLSFSLNRYYSSSDSRMFDKQTEFTYFCVCYIFSDAKLVMQYSTDGVNVDYFRVLQDYQIYYGPEHAPDGTLTNRLDALSWFSYVNDLRGTTPEWSVGNWSSEPDDNGYLYRTAYYVPSDANTTIRDYYTGPMQQIWRNVAKNKSYEQQLYPLGNGWTWDIPYIKTVEGTSYLNMGSQGSYEISYNTLKGYPWKDLTIENNNSVNVQGELSVKAVKSTQGRNYYFAQDGRLIQISDRYDNTIQFRYSYHDKYGKVLTKITDALNNEIQISYDAWGITLVQGDKEIRYTKHKTSKNGGMPFHKSYESEYLYAASDPSGKTTYYDYDQSNANYNLNDFEAVNNPFFLLKNIRYPNGARSEYTYDSTPIARTIGTEASEQVYRIQTRRDVSNTGIYNTSNFTYQSDFASSYGQDIANFGVTVSNAINSTAYDYRKDYINDTTPTVYYTNSVTSIAGDEKNVTTFEYDEARRRTSPLKTTATFYKGTNPGTPVINQVTYDDYGNTLTETNAMGITSTYSYDPIFHQVATASQPIDDQKTVHSQFTRNDKGLVTEVTVKDQSNTLLAHSKFEDIDIHGNVGKATIYDDNRNRVYTNEYGSNGGFLTKQTIHATDANNQVQVVDSSAQYNASTGQMTSITDGNNNTTSYQYDSLGRLTMVTNPDQTTATASYNDGANEATFTDETGVTSTIKWDSIGQKMEEGIVDGAYRMLRKYGYDGLGQLSWEEDANNQRTSYSYDNWGRMVQSTAPNGAVSAVAYDGIQRTQTATDPEGIQSRVTTDILGRQIASDINKGSGFEQTSSSIYDYVGNLLSSTANGETTNYGYDVLGRLTHVSQPNQETTTYSYSLAGNLKSIHYPNGTSVQKQYDELGRIRKKIDQAGKEEKAFYDDNSNLVKSVDKKGQVFTYQYNNRNLMFQKNSPSSQTDYTYDGAGRRKSMNDSTGLTRYSYKPTTGELDKVTFPDGKTIDYTYNNLGLRETLKDPFDMTKEYTYDNMNRLHTIGSPEASVDATYEYFDNNLLEKTEQKNGVTSNYTYDGYNLATLTHKKSDGALINSFTYTTQLNGNITQLAENRNGQSQTYDFTYDALDRIQTSSQFNENYTYDSLGNRSVMESDLMYNMNLGEINYQYDDWNQLIEVSKGSGERIQYKYNGDGLMVERTENNETTRYYYDGNQIIAEGTVVNGVVTLKAQYIRGKSLVGRQDASGTAYYLHNGHGDVVEIRDSTGNVSLNQYSYDIWGNPVKTVETVSNPFRYSGELWDQSTGLQYLRARWYDPSMGRFITKDTYEGQLTNPLSQNLYTYVHNNPLSNIDPSGNFCVSKDGQNSHLGNCDKNGISVDLGNDNGILEYTPIISNGQIIGEVDKNGGFRKVASYTMNFWDWVSTTFTPEQWDKTYKAYAVNAFVDECMQANFCSSYSHGWGLGKGIKAGKPAKSSKNAFPCNCFTAGTKVQTDEGEKPIEEIEIGDKVLSKSDETGEVAYKEVVGLFQKQADEIYKVHISDEVIEATAEHPFWLDGKGWTEVKDLKVGDLLVSSDGTTLAIDKIEKEPREATVYNFEVKDFHSYFVSNLGVWVHNCATKNKGNEFRGGSKKDRDNWYGYNDKDFQHWWHREGKEDNGGNDIDNSTEAKEAYDQWVELGKPKKKNK